MDGAAQLRLAFDVHHLTLAQAHGGGDTRRHTEAETAQLQHREAVDLADLRAVGIDQHQTTLDALVHLVTHAVQAINLGIDRTNWMQCLCATPRLGRMVVALAR